MKMSLGNKESKIKKKSQNMTFSGKYIFSHIKNIITFVFVYLTSQKIQNCLEIGYLRPFVGYGNNTMR